MEASIRVLAEDGFAHASARAIATAARTVNGSIFYYFGSMDGLLAATIPGCRADVHGGDEHGRAAGQKGPEAGGRTRCRSDRITPATITG